MAEEGEHELPEGISRPGEDPVQQQKQMISFTMMSEMITALEEGKLSLTLAVKSLKEQLEQQKTDAMDIYYYLNKKCDDSYELIATLEEQLLTEQADREVAEKQYEDQYALRVQQAEVTESKLKETISKQTQKLNDLDKFLDQKEAMEDDMKAVKATMETERENDKATRTDMQQTWLEEKNKLRKQYDASLKALREEMDAKLVNQLTEKTIAINKRNIEMLAELKHQSGQANQVLVYNQTTVDKDRQLRVNLELASSVEEEMAKKLTMYQRMLKELNGQMEGFDAERAALQAEHDQAVEARDVTLNENAKLREASKQSMFYRAGKMMHFLLSSTRDVIGEEAYGMVVGGDLMQSLHSETDVSKKHETMLLRLVRALVRKHPEVFPASGPDLTQHIAFFPPLSPKGGGGGGGGSSSSSVGGSSVTPKRTVPRGFQFTQTKATQTDEHRDPLQSDSMWLTGKAGIKRAGDGAMGNNDDDSTGSRSPSSLFEGGHWGSIDLGSVDPYSYGGGGGNQLSVKSTSAVPPRKPKGLHPNGKSQGRGGFGGKQIGGVETLSLDGGMGGRLNKKTMGGSGSGSGSGSRSGQDQRQQRLQMEGSSMSLAPRIVEFGGGSGDDDSMRSPQSSVSMSPRGASFSLEGDENTTIGTISPRAELDESMA